jgi:hypothetical protein
MKADDDHMEAQRTFEEAATVFGEDSRQRIRTLGG